MAVKKRVPKKAEKAVPKEMVVAVKITESLTRVHRRGMST